MREKTACRICEIGGGANPAISADVVAAEGIEYTVLDISRAELDKAPEGYHKVEADITSQLISIPGHFDIVFSRMLAEHVPNAKRFHENVYDLLRPGGIALHFFPTLYALPFVVNKMLPQEASRYLLDRVLPGRRAGNTRSKFPAFYRWCLGPVPRQIRRLEGVGFTVLMYRGFFGTLYYQRVPPLQAVDRWMTRKLLARPIPSLTSFAYVVLQKPM